MKVLILSDIHGSSYYAKKIEEIYAKVFKSEDALVRAQFISGTHALAITLSALSLPVKFLATYNTNQGHSVSS